VGARAAAATHPSAETAAIPTNYTARERARHIAPELSRWLLVEFGESIDRAEIEDVVQDAVAQLSHSVHPEALPEMAFRLAYYRLENLPPAASAVRSPAEERAISRAR